MGESKVAHQEIYLPVSTDNGRVAYDFIEYDIKSLPPPEHLELADGWEWQVFELKPKLPTEKSVIEQAAKRLGVYQDKYSDESKVCIDAYYELEIRFNSAGEIIAFDTHP